MLGLAKKSVISEIISFALPAVKEAVHYFLKNQSENPFRQAITDLSRQITAMQIENRNLEKKINSLEQELGAIKTRTAVFITAFFFLLAAAGALLVFSR